MKTCIQNLAVNDIHRFIFQWCGRIVKWMFWRPNCIKNFTKAQSLKFTTNDRTKKAKTWFKLWFVFIWSLIRSLAIKEQCSFCQIEWWHIKWHLLNVIVLLLYNQKMLFNIWYVARCSKLDNKTAHNLILIDS